MSAVVLLLNQDGISELIETANEIQGRVDAVLNANAKPKDRYADASAPTTFLEAAKEKLPMILEEGDDEEQSEAQKLSSEFSNGLELVFHDFSHTFCST